MTLFRVRQEDLRPGVIFRRTSGRVTFPAHLGVPAGRLQTHVYDPVVGNVHAQKWQAAIVNFCVREPDKYLIITILPS